MIFFLNNLDFRLNAPALQFGMAGDIFLTTYVQKYTPNEITMYTHRLYPTAH